jgi:hypothetical protein
MFYENGFNITKMTDPRTALICARFNLRGGKRRLQKGITTAGVVALYDSLLFGMRYYITRHERCRSFLENIDLWDVMSMFEALTKAGVFEDRLSFNRFSLLVERTLWQGSFSLDPDAVLTEVEEMLTILGVMPFHVNGSSQKSRI